MAPQRTLEFARQHPAPVYVNLVHPYQRRYLEILDDPNNWDYDALIDIIEEADREHGPNPKMSRINTEVVPDWKVITLTLMMRTDREILQAASSNDLPRRAVTTYVDDDKIEIRTAAGALPVTQNDAVVYANWLARRDGSGLTRDEFVRLLAFLRRVAADPRGPDRRRIDQMHNTWPGTRIGLMQGFSATEADKLERFCTYHEQVTISRFDADPTVERIMIPGEVGWTMQYILRAAAHRDLTSGSPWVFRLVSCALKHLFDASFIMHQFVLFDIVRPEEANVAESIASHLLASYIGYGGFNFDQAGLTATSMYKVNMTDTWLQIANLAVRRNYFPMADSNFRALQTYVEERGRRADVRRDYA